MSSAGRSRAVAWGAGLLVALAVATAAADFVVEQRAEAVIERERNIVLHVERLLSTMKDAETGQRGYLITGDETYLAPYVSAQAAIEDEFTSLRAELGDRATPLVQLARDRLDSARQGIAIYKAGGATVAADAVRGGRGKALMDALRERVATTQQEADVSIRHTRAEALVTTSLLRGLSLAATLLGFAGIALVALRRRRAQQASGALLQNVLDNAPVGLGFLDAALHVGQMNHALAAMSERGLGLSVGEGLFAQLPQLRDAFAARLPSVVQGGRAIAEVDVEVPAPDDPVLRREYRIGFYPLRPSEADEGAEALGGIAWLRALSRRLVGGSTTPAGAGMVVSDVTHRRRAERWLKESEERFRTLAQASSAIIWSAGPEGAFTSPQREWERVTGQAHDASLGWGWLDVVHPDDREATQEAFAAAVAERRPLAFEHRLRRADGAWRHMALSAAPLMGPSGIREWVGTQTDITERKDAAIELAAAKDAAEAANRAKSVFLANMSHELRTPLSAVIGYSEMLEEEVADMGEQGLLGDLGKIKSNARHLLGLINDVLDLSKIEANRMDTFLEVVTVRTLAADVASTVDALVRQKNNRLVLALGEGDLGTMRTDAVKLRQCLFNLLGNAAKFTTDGEITLSVRREREGDADWLAFVVADTGIGMTPAQVARLFARFAQADETTTRRFGGTGLGLAISRAFARLLGGDITVASLEGVGTTFTLRLPADAGARPDTASAAPASSPEPSRAEGQDLVLVIDDEPAQRDLTSRFLTRLGFAVETAADGPAGIAAARRLRPRAILLDVMMPGMDGWSVLGTMKADPDLAMIPVVMVTFVDDHGMATSLGADSHVDKPVDWDRLKGVMDRFHDRDGDVLVVDDDRGARERLRVSLERGGWTVREAANGAEALAHVREACPRTILLDLTMPVMDGFAFLDALRAMPKGADIPVIVLSARDMTLAERARLESADMILAKGEVSLAAIVGEVKALDEARAPRVDPSSNIRSSGFAPD